MRALGAFVIALGACYHGSSELPACSVRCEEGCPDGTHCVDGYCTGGTSCGSGSAGSDAGPTCGGIGEACCATGTACESNGYCVAGTCEAGCITDVMFGRRHACMLRHDGTVWCAGQDDSGQLGDGKSTDSATFVQATDSSGPITDAIAVGGGYYTTCAVRTGGTVWCWGAGSSGELGNNASTTSSTAVQVVTASGPLTGIVEVDGGHGHECARDAAGAVWCWGRNDGGQLGDNTTTNRPYAAQVAGIPGATRVSTGIDHTCAVIGGAHVMCWGFSYYGEIGDGAGTTRLAPVAVTDAADVSAGGWTSCALHADGTVSCWGRGMQGRLGNGSDAEVDTPKPAMISGVASIAVGGVSCAVTTDHRLMCWGVNPHGQVGNGAGSLVPVEILTGIDKVYAHYAHVCAHGVDGSLACWGRNSEGELGDGKRVDLGSPEPIVSICP